MILKVDIKKKHAEDWLLFGKNLGNYLSLDETSVSNGELYTILTNKSAKGKKGSIIAIVKGIWSRKLQWIWLVQ